MPKRRYCNVFMCKNTSDNTPKRTSWHLLPKDPRRRKVWIDNIKLDRAGNPYDDTVKHAHICSAHFTKDSFKSLTRKYRRHLRGVAIPTIFPWTANKAKDEELAEVELGQEDEEKGVDESQASNGPPSKSARNSRQLRQLEVHDVMEFEIIDDSMNIETINDDKDSDMAEEFYDTKKADTLTESVWLLKKEKRRLAKDNDKLKREIYSLLTQHSMLNQESDAQKQKNVLDRVQFECATAKLEDRLLSYEKIKHDNNLVSFYTGFKDDLSFTTFYAYLEDKAKALTYVHGSGKGRHAKRLSTPIPLDSGETFTITDRDMLFLVLVRLKVGFPTTEIARMFGIAMTIVKRIFATWISFLYVELKALFPVPNLPTGAQLSRSEGCSLVMLTIDCSDVRVQKTAMLKTQENHLYTYKHFKAMKFLLATMSNGSVCFVSPLFDGRASDKQIVEDSGLIKFLSAGYTILANARFKISDILPKDVCLIMVSDVTNTTEHNPMPSSQAVGKSKEGGDKFNMERALRRIKMYHILDTPIPLPLVVHADQIVAVCAYLTNLKTGVMKRITPLRVGGVATST